MSGNVLANHRTVHVSQILATVRAIELARCGADAGLKVLSVRVDFDPEAPASSALKSPRFAASHFVRSSFVGAAGVFLDPVRYEYQSLAEAVDKYNSLDVGQPYPGAGEMFAPVFTNAPRDAAGVRGVHPAVVSEPRIRKPRVRFSAPYRITRASGSTWCAVVDFQHVELADYGALTKRLTEARAAYRKQQATDRKTRKGKQS